MVNVVSGSGGGGSVGGPLLQLLQFYCSVQNLPKLKLATHIKNQLVTHIKSQHKGVWSVVAIVAIPLFRPNSTCNSY